jgi:hypothetical protein
MFFLRFAAFLLNQISEFGLKLAHELVAVLHLIVVHPFSLCKVVSECGCSKYTYLR